MKIFILNFSNIYLQENFFQDKEHQLIDCADIDGTNCYCDDDAYATIINKTIQTEHEAIHFIDSGNFHYLSKLWTDKIQEKFNLLVFDHHTDMQEPQFGDILSCGGWIKKVLDENKHINRVILIGVRDDLAEQIPSSYEDKVICINESSVSDVNLNELTAKIEDFPLYVSIDKDALCSDDAVTNWDQGTMTLSQIKLIIKAFSNKNKIIGVDICGEPNVDDSNADAERINSTTNSILIDFLNEL